MKPVDALLEIATLLERERASRYRSRAFRAAAAVLGELDEAEVADAAGLRRRRGIGESSFEVIQQALHGDVPDYLQTLRERYAPAPSALRAQLRGDLHCHSDWSDGTTPIADMVDAARALGHEYLALTDHSPRLRIAHGLTKERLRAQLAELPAFCTDDLLCGAASRWTSSTTDDSIRSACSCTDSTSWWRRCTRSSACRRMP